MRALIFLLPTVLAGGGSGAFMGIMAGAAALFIISSSASSDSDDPSSGGTVTHNVTHTDLITGNSTRRLVTEAYSCAKDSDLAYLSYTAPERKDVAEGTVIRVKTPWYVLYHKQLDNKFEKLGLKGLRSSSTCGWFFLAEVNAAKVWRGNIEFYNSRYMKDGVDVDDTMIPSDELVGEIKEIMLKTYPAIEIFLIVFCTVGVLIGIPAGLILLCCCRSCWRRRKQRASSPPRYSV